MLNYVGINCYANTVRNNTGIRDIIDFNLFFKNLGAKINLLSVDDWEGGKYPFVSVNENGFNIFICECFPYDLKRVFFLKALGHYLLHFEMGKKFGKVNNKIKEQANKDALYFALSLLMPDDEIIDLLKINFDKSIIAKLFRVPIQMVDFKISVLNGYRVLLN